METTEQLPAGPKPSPSEALRAGIAAKIREDSSTLAAPTPSAALAGFFEDLTVEEAEPVLLDLLNDEDYADIKALTTSDDLFFYSTLYLEPPSAEEQVQAQEVMYRVATTVRQQSKETAQLTDVTSLDSLLSDLQNPEGPELQVQSFLPQLLADDRYEDIRSLSLSSGALYLYSSHYITESYAKLLARTETGDAMATIADTVREESRIYPRPTKIRLFTARPFHMKWDEIPQVVDQLLTREEYSDIKKIVAPTGAVYLYSERHLTSRHAQSLVEWEEVEQVENP